MRNRTSDDRTWHPSVFNFISAEFGWVPSATDKRDIVFFSVIDASLLENEPFYHDSFSRGLLKLERVENVLPVVQSFNIERYHVSERANL